MRAELAESEPDVVAIDFNPWWFSSREDIIRNFLRELASISKTEIGNDKLASAFYVLSNVLALAPAVASGAALAMGNAEVVASPEAQNVFGKLRQGSKWGRKVGDKLSIPPSIEDLRETITEGLARSKKRIWVFVDDVDRLQRDEMLAMFSLLRSIGELPYIKYVVAVAFEGAEHSLESPNLVRSYVAKVLTDSYYLPQIGSTTLQQHFARRLGQSWASFGELQHEYSTHISQAFEVIPTRFVTPRFIEQLANTTVRALKTNQLEGEIALHDLILLEALRLCFQKAHSFVIERRSWLTQLNANLSANDRSSQLESELADYCSDYESLERDEAMRILWSLFPNLNPSDKFYINRFGPNRAWNSAVLAAYVMGDADAAGISQRRRKELWETLGSHTPLGFNNQIVGEPEDTYLALKEWIDQQSTLDARDIAKILRYARAFYYSLDNQPKYNFLARNAILLTPFYCLEKVEPETRKEFLEQLMDECLNEAPIDALVDLRDLLEGNQLMASMETWKEAEKHFFIEISRRAMSAVKDSILDGMRSDLPPRLLRAGLYAWSPDLSDVLRDLNAEATRKFAAAALSIYKNASTLEHIELLSPIFESPVFDVMLQDEGVREALVRDRKHLKEAQAATNGGEGADPEGLGVQG